MWPVFLLTSWTSIVNGYSQKGKTDKVLPGFEPGFWESTGLAQSRRSVGPFIARESKSQVIDHYTTGPLECHSPHINSKEANWEGKNDCVSILSRLRLYYAISCSSPSCDLWLPSADFRHGRVVWPVRASCPSQVFNPWLFVEGMSAGVTKKDKQGLTAFHDGVAFFTIWSSVGGRCRMC